MVDISTITANPLFLGIVFILFVLAIKRVTKILLNCVWITVAAVLFPIIGNKALGLSIPIDADSIIFFITVGIGTYFVYLFASSIYKVLAVVQKETEPVTTFLGNSFQRIKEKMRRKEDKEEKKFKKKEEEIKKRGEELRKKEEELQRIEEEKEQKMKEIEMKSFKTTKQLAPKKDPFEDYLIIEDPKVKEVKEKPLKKKSKSESIIKKFKETED